MAESLKSWVVLRDGDRKLCCTDIKPADELLFLACLSTDPRSLDEFATAWARYRPDQPLMNATWIPLAEFETGPAADQVWLWIDFTQCCFAWHGCNDQPLSPGGYATLPEPLPRIKSKIKRTKGQKKRDKLRGINRDQPRPKVPPSIWLNIPEWWERCPAIQFPGFNANLERTSILDGSIATLDFRRILYGRPLAEFIAQGVRSAMHTAASTHTATEGGGPCGSTLDDDHDDEHDDFDSMQKSVLLGIRKVHASWLMTARLDLGDRIPREFLHRHRDWKDRELDQRRNQWSVTRTPPPGLSPTSRQFHFGPMGTEEVVIYFDLCRETIMAAWRWVDDEPHIDDDKLVTDIERFIDGWLHAELPDGDGATAQQIIDNERMLIPRLASSEPFDCNCPLCRLQSQNSDLFGPAFSICDGYHLEMEDEFAFSLTTDREEWEETRESWNDEGDDPMVSCSPIDLPGSQVMMASVRIPMRGNTAPDLDAADFEIWKSSYIDPDTRSPQLSLLAIGTRLSELITELQEMSAPPEVLENLNCAFDELGRAIRTWLVEEATGGPRITPISQVVGDMVSELEKVANDYPALTAQSADLQSLVHDWQRQLT